MLGLLNQNDIEHPLWIESQTIPGFNTIESYPSDKTIKARGWMLWLSGLFEQTEITFWDTLKDRYSKQPRLQLPDIELELEIIIARK